MTPCALLLGTPVDDVTLAEAVAQIDELAAEGRSSGRVHQVATVNVDFVVNADADAELLAILQRAKLSIPDGMGVVWGARLLGTPIRERTSGADLVPALAERCAATGRRLCLFGGAPGVVAEAVTLLRQRFPDADVVGLEAPAVGLDASMAVDTLDDLRALDADIVAVALGNPKQERWIARHGTALGAPVCIGIGGSLDFLTGVTTRAPGWMRRSGLEWVHRLLSEPRRLARRYGRDLVIFGPKVVAQAIRGRRRRHAGSVRVEAIGDRMIVDVGGLRHVDNRSAAEIVRHLRNAARADTPTAVVGLSEATCADAALLGIDALLMASR